MTPEERVNYCATFRSRPTPASAFGISIFIFLSATYFNWGYLRDNNLVAPAIVLVGVLSAIFLFVEPIPQPVSYHNFADKRCMLCRCGGQMFLPPNILESRVQGRGRGWIVLPNFGDVSSNVVILVGGVAGLVLLANAELLDLAETDAWQVTVCLPAFFGGTLLTAFGSAYYHWEPSNASLVWDRLPMTVAFASIFSFMLDDYLPPFKGEEGGIEIDAGVGRDILLPLVVLGAASVWYWHWTDDLRPYAVVSIFPMLAMPLLQLVFRPRHTGIAWQSAGLVLYAAAKFCEDRDHQIFLWTGKRISGHSLKHILAGVAPISIACMMVTRERFF